MPKSASLPKIIAFAALLLAGAAGPLAGQGRSFLREDVEFLSDTLCRGRGAGTAGACEAASYIVRRFSGIPGLVPAGDSWADSFSLPDGKTGHNVAAFLPASGAGGRGSDNGVVIVMAALDGLGVLGGTVYPGADSDASGVAAMLRIAERLAAVPVRPRAVLFVALDGHFQKYSGASRLWNRIAGGLLSDPEDGRSLRRGRVSLVVNLDIIGSNLSPVVKYRREYLIALGGVPYAQRLGKCNPDDLHLSYDYYGSRDFTDLFYRKLGDHKVFLDGGCPCVVFTSGITMLTNKPGDVASSLDYGLLEKRAALIASWLSGPLR